MSKKYQYYFENENDDKCYTREHFDEIMKKENKPAVKVVKANPVKDCDFFWCNKYRDIYQRGDCSSECDYYEPRNGKSGCCKHFSETLYEQGDKVILTLK